MPVLGHAFVGLAIGTWTHPNTQVDSFPQPHSFGKTLWTPLAIGLSYCPDILAQLGQLVLGYDLRQVTHAAPIAVLLAFVMAPIVAAFYRQPFSRAFLLVFTCLLLHDLMDLLQATDRTFWWPFSYGVVGPKEPLLPNDPRKEAQLFAALYVIALLAYWWRHRADPQARHISLYASWRFSSFSWLNVVITTALMLAAVITHQLRQAREDQLAYARTLSHEHHAYPEAFSALDQAERWPSTAKPGRIDYLRAWTYEQMKDRMQAERYYLRSYQADPTYFWALADLVVFYSSSDHPVAERRQLIAPYLRRLNEEFSGHHNLRETLDRVEQGLAQASAATGQADNLSATKHP